MAAMAAEPSSTSPKRPAAGSIKRAHTPPPRGGLQATEATPFASPAGVGAGRPKRTVHLEPPEVRLGFIRKVYGILSAQLAFTIAVSATVTLNKSLRDRVLYLGVYWPGTFHWGLVIATVLMLVLLHAKKNEVPTNYYLLAGFTLLNSLSLSFGLSMIHAQLHEQGDNMIIHAAGITLAIFLGLTAYTFKSDRNFSFMGAYLHMSLWGMLVAGFVFWFFNIHALDALVCWFGALMFSGYIIYDTWKLSKVYGPDDYIPATIELYLDVINLFMYILKILMRNASKEDKKKK